jgi:hypothetical protein
MAWRLTCCRWSDRARIDHYLGENWEPFAVTEEDGTMIWLRLWVAPHAAIAERPAPVLELGERAAR